MILALGNVTKFSGRDATLGLALAHPGALYPCFGTLPGWLGVALTDSYTASNVLFGSLQKIAAQQLGINPVLMCAANTFGVVAGRAQFHVPPPERASKTQPSLARCAEKVGKFTAHLALVIYPV